MGCLACFGLTLAHFHLKGHAMRKTIKIPMLFDGIDGRPNNNKTVVGVVDHEITIREPSEHAAPIAYQVIMPRQMPFFDRFEYRVFNGTLYSKAFRRTNPETSRGSEAWLSNFRDEAWAAAKSALSGSLYPPGVSALFKEKKPNWQEMEKQLGEAGRQINPSSIGLSQIDSWRSNADAIAERFIVVDGYSYVSSCEPLYTVDLIRPHGLGWTRPSNGNVFAETERSYRGGEFKKNLTDTPFRVHFNSSQEEEARALFERLQPGKALDPEKTPRIERWSDEYRQSDTIALETERVAKVLLNDVSWGLAKRSRTSPFILDENGARVYAAVLELKKAVSRRNGDMPDEDIDVAMEEVLDAAVGGTRTRELVRPVMREMANFSIERWRSRPVVIAPGRPCIRL